MPLLYSTPVSLYRDAIDAEIQRLFSVGIIPEDFLSDIFDKVGIVQASAGYDEALSSWSFTTTIEIDGELSLALPGLDFFKILIGADPESSSNNLVLNIVVHYVDGVLSLALLDTDVILEVSGLGFFQALVADTEGTYTLDATTYRPSEITPLRFYSEKGFEFYFDSSGQISISEPEGWSFSPFCIPALGIGFNINNMLLRLSTGNDLPVILSDLGYDPDWTGLYCESFQLIFAEGSLLGGIIDDLTIENLALGRGGFSGKITGGPWSPILNNAGDGFEPGYGVTELFGIPLGVQSVAIEFKENSFVSSSITAQMILPFFDMVLDVEIGFTNDGDFTVALGATDGLLELQKPGVIVIEVSSLEFVKEEDEFLFRLSGKVTPLLADIAWPSFELKGLSIGTDGTVSVEGGWIELPDQKALDFHGFQVEIAQLGFGSDELEGALYKWVGFSGGIQILPALPLKGGVEGLKVMWTEDGQFKLKIGGVYLSFEIKGVLTFDGSVYFIDEENPDIKEFRGSVDVNLIPINFGVDAQFIAGEREGVKYFLIGIGIDLPVGIPLGPPVLGLYGLAGLYGHNMSLDYNNLINYDTVSERPDLSDVDIWDFQKDAMAFGAGLTVGTLPDVKFTVKAKALFVILIPGPVILIEGHAGMLSLNENFLMQVLAVLDPTAGTFLMNISASYQYSKEEGKLLNISGSAEAYFSAADPGSWHLYLGENQPEAKRIRADILNFFKAQTYLMIDHDGLLMGAWIGYSLDEKYGILRVILEAWMGGELGISTMPFQAKGSVTLYGNAELSASIVSLGISVEANVTVEAPKPLYISASLEVQLKTPLGKPKAKIKLKWEEEGVPLYPVPLSPTLGVEHRKVTKNWEIPKYSPYAVDEDGLFTGVEVPVAIPEVPVVPPDVYLVLNFDKPVIDSNLVGANPSSITNYENVGDYEFKYELRSVTLQYRDTWEEIDDDNDDDWNDFVGPIGDYALAGYWQFIPNTEDIVNTKLILNATTPFEISRLLEENELWYSLLDVYHPTYPCIGEVSIEELCADFENRDTGYHYGTLVQDAFIFTSPFPMVVHGYPAPWLGTEKALNNTDGYQTIECLNIKAQEPTGELNLKVIKEVLITAGVGYNSYLKLTDEYSEADIELYINQSSLDLANGIIPVFIHFPKPSFGETPYKVWITCIVGDAGEYVYYAFDDEGNVIDKAKLSEGRNVNGAVVYTLEADVPIRKIGLLGHGFRILDICWPVHHPVENTNILVTLPEEVVKAELHLSKDSQGTVYLYDRENSELQQVEFDIPEDLPDEEVQPVTLQTSSAEPFRSFLVLGRFDIIRVCGITEEAQETYDYNAGLETHLKDSLEENWGKHTAQILEPNKYYRLKIETVSSRRKNGGDWDERVFTENMYFKTGNPPGPPASTQTEVGDDTAARYDLEGPLMDLNAYIDYTIPAGAAADEAQPYIYRSYDIGVVYNDSYVDQMYQMAELPIKIKLLDNNNLPVLNAAGEVLEFVNLWGDNPELSLTREETRYEDILDDRGCIIMTGVTSETNKEIIASSRELLLKPRIQYRAQVLAGEDMPVYEFAFLTSRYANFMHHIHAFEEMLWNHFELLQDAAYEVDRAVLSQLLNNAEDEAVKFEQLMEFFELNPRTLPERLEITMMNDKDQSYGFLLETPEPLDWERCELTMAFADKNEGIAWSDSVVKIVCGSADSIANPLRIVEGDYNHQWIDILLLESYDLSGCTLEYRPVSADEEDAYQTYYTFESSSSYLAGTLVSVFNGAAPDSGSTDIESIHLYARHLADISSPDGTVFRIRDQQGEILHTFILYKDTVFDALSFNIIRNEDGTRLFVFMPDGTQPYSALQEGIYQWAFTYSRDIGSSPVLKRFGFSDEEKAVIRFSLANFATGS